jgi:hypothetical protein
MMSNSVNLDLGTTIACASARVKWSSRASSWNGPWHLLNSHGVWAAAGTGALASVAHPHRPGHTGHHLRGHTAPSAVDTDR